MRRSTLALLAACGLAAAAWAGDDPAARDTEALQGDWRAVKGTAEGQKPPTAEAEMFRIAVKGDRLTLSAGGGDRKARFKLDPAKSPKAIDLMLGQLGGALPRELTGRTRYRAWGIV